MNHERANCSRVAGIRYLIGVIGGLQEGLNMPNITDEELNKWINGFDDIVPRWLTDEQLRAYEVCAYNTYLDAQKEIYFREILNETRLNKGDKA